MGGTQKYWTQNDVDRLQICDITSNKVIADIIYQKDHQPIGWKNISSELRYWIGGQHDTDGSSNISENSGLRISVSKAKNGYSTLETLKSLLGGDITLKQTETETQQEQKSWCIRGKKAIDFCANMQDYVFLKRRQLVLGAEYPFVELQAMQMSPIKGLNLSTKEINTFGSAAAAGEICARKPFQHFTSCRQTAPSCL